MSSPTVTATGAWTAAHDLPTAAAWFGQHDGPVLLAGSTKVLLVGGADSASAPVSQAALYDPAADSWQPAGTVLTPRHLPTLTGLSDGKALLAGGIGGSGPTALGTAELYDPTANAWTATGALATPRWGHSAVLLADKRVLALSNSMMICRCCSIACSVPLPPRPVFWTARCSGVEPLRFLARGIAPPANSASTAAAHRVRTARCNGCTPLLSDETGSAPAWIRQWIVAACAVGLQTLQSAA